MLKEYICDTCGVKYTSDFWSKYCSPLCRNRRSRGIGTETVTFYSIETPCKCGCGQIIMNPDDHYRYRKFIPEHRNSGGTHPRLGKTESDNHIEFRLSRMHSSMRNRDTCIEKQLYSYLDSTKLVYEKQKQIGRTRPDAFIPSLNLCIYADGRYWHCREKDTDRDARGEEILKTRGYSFIRLNDLEKMNSLDIKPLQDCIGRLVEA